MKIKIKYVIISFLAIALITLYCINVFSGYTEKWYVDSNNMDKLIIFNNNGIKVELGYPKTSYYSYLKRDNNLAYSLSSYLYISNESNRYQFTLKQFGCEIEKDNKKMHYNTDLSSQYQWYIPVDNIVEIPLLSGEMGGRFNYSIIDHRILFDNEIWMNIEMIYEINGQTIKYKDRLLLKRKIKRHSLTDIELDYYNMLDLD